MHFNFYINKEFNKGKYLYMKNRKSNLDQIIKIREDIYIQKNNIDCIIKTKTSPKDSVTVLKDYVYVVYLKNSKYNWIQLSIEEFNKYLQKYL